MLYARIARFDVMATIALFGKVFGTKQGLSRLYEENLAKRTNQKKDGKFSSTW